MLQCTGGGGEGVSYKAVNMFQEEEEKECARRTLPQKQESKELEVCMHVVSLVYLCFEF